MDVYTRRRIEACGVLIGSIDEAGRWHIEKVHPLRNIFNSPVYFEFDPEDLLMADLAYPGEIVGAYHSHPTGLARASITDRQNMKRINSEQRIPWVWLIVSGPFEQDSPLLQQEGCCPELPSDSSIIAYHYYPGKGVRRINVQFKEAEE